MSLAYFSTVSNRIDIMRSANGMSALFCSGNWTALMFPPLILGKETCVPRYMQPNQRHKFLKRLRNFQTTRPGSVDDALDVDVDCINPARAVDATSVSKRGRNNACRKAGQRSDFDHALRGENAD